VDLLAASDARGETLAAVWIGDGGLQPLPLDQAPKETGSVSRIGGRLYTISRLPVGLRDETIGSLTVGRLFDLSDFAAGTALTWNGALVETNLAAAAELEGQLAACDPVAECEVRLGGELFLSLPFRALQLGNGYQLHSLQSVDAVEAPLLALIRRVSLAAGSFALALVLLTSLASSRSIVRPITTLTQRLQTLPPDGVPPALEIAAATREVEQLVSSFNRSSAQIRDARGRLTRAHTQFIEAMTSAVDARDVYTLGHSRRVSEYAVRVAERMGVAQSGLETIRVGALLHDVGKIGIPDAILGKPGKLTKDEMGFIQLHPTIGRHIVEHVDGFSAYLPVIELHHENHDGSGYPTGLSGEQTPLLARIVHVVDAYDAMTSNRPYRVGMTHDQAAAILRQGCGSQFDPEIVRSFLEITKQALAPETPERQSFAHQLDALARNVRQLTGSPAREASG
jgi:HD-GYP domain-containing protein (c-di-GMP phosphodiesterase class II)